MKMNIDALKALELKLAEYSKANGAIAEHKSENANCSRGCVMSCSGTMNTGCGSCTDACRGSCRSTAR